MDEELIEKNKLRLFWYATIVILLVIGPLFFLGRLESAQLQLFAVAIVSLGALSSSSMLHSMWRRIEETGGKSAIVLLSWKPFLWPAIISAAVTSFVQINNVPAISVQMAMTLIMIVTGAQMAMLGANREAVKGTDELNKIPRFSKALHYGTVLGAIGIVGIHFVLPEQMREFGLFASGVVIVAVVLALVVQGKASIKTTRAFKRKKAASDPKERLDWLKYDATRKWFRPVLFLIMPLWMGGLVFGIFVSEIYNLVMPAFFGTMMVVVCHSMLFSLETIPGKDLELVKSRNRVRMFLSLSLILGILGLGYRYPKDQQALEVILIAIIVIYAAAFLFFAWRAVKASKNDPTNIGDGGEIVEG